MWRVVQKVEREAAEHLRAYGLNYAQFDVLAHVGVAEGSRQKELGESLHVTKGNVSHLVGQMERRGLVSRRQEGRTNRLYLTEEGRREVVPAHEDLVHQLMSALPEEEQARSTSCCEVWTASCSGRAEDCSLAAPTAVAKAPHPRPKLQADALPGEVSVRALVVAMHS